MTPLEANLDTERFGVYGTNTAGHATITYTRILKHPVEKVWRAITEEEHRAAWFPELSLGAATGDDAIVNFSGAECPPPEDNPSDVYYCKVTRCEPPHVLEYIGPKEHHKFELAQIDEGCRLTFMAILPEATAFDDDSKTIQSRYSVACGWHYKLDVMECGLDGVQVEDEGYAGPIKTKYYFVYRKLDKRGTA